MSTSFIDRDLALLGLAGLGTSLEDGHVSATCRLPARPPTPSSVPKNPTHAPPSVAPIPPSVTRTKPRSTRKERRPAGKRKLEELARDDAQKDLRTVMLLAEIAQEISERERVIELESLRLADGLAQKRLIELYADAIDLR